MTISITIRSSRSGPEKPLAGFAGAMGLTKPDDTERDEVEMYIDNDEPAADVLGSLAAAASTAYGMVFLEDDDEKDDTPGIYDEARGFAFAARAEAIKLVQEEDPDGPPRPIRAGDAVILHFDDGSQGTYIFDGLDYHHPEHRGEGQYADGTVYRQGDPSIRSTRFLASHDGVN